MIVYHGSNHKFKNPDLRYIKKYSKNTDGGREGYGLYCTTDKSDAEKFGKYVYSVEVNTRDVGAFNTLRSCMLLVERMRNAVYGRTHIRIEMYINLSEIVDNLLSGKEPMVSVVETVKRRVIEEYNFCFYTPTADDIKDVLDEFNKYHMPTLYFVNGDTDGTVIIKDLRRIQNFKLEYTV